MASAIRPLIGLPACVTRVGDLTFHTLGEKYAIAAAEGAGGTPVMIPSLGAETLDLDAVVARLDGLLVTGSPSNVHPSAYGGPASLPGTLLDPARDATVLALIPRALEAGVPLLALCRGFQELNVALGGTLHQRLQDLPGRMDHRAPVDAPADVRYARVHAVRLAPGGTLAALAGAGEIQVNSLHAQGIDRLAPGLAVEATAPDGVIEAVRVVAAETFALGIQWHPEWAFRGDVFSRRLFRAFGDAARARAAARAGAPVAAPVA